MDIYQKAREPLLLLGPRWYEYSLNATPKQETHDPATQFLQAMYFGQFLSGCKQNNRTVWTLHDDRRDLCLSDLPSLNFIAVNNPFAGDITPMRFDAPIWLRLEARAAHAGFANVADFANAACTNYFAALHDVSAGAKLCMQNEKMMVAQLSRRMLCSY